MPNPFPGMNPYLENPEIWPEVHHLLISSLPESLNPQLLPRYRVAIEKRIYWMSESDAVFVGIPDATVARSRTTPNPSNAPVAVATPPATPITVTVPMPMEFREGYLEVRDTTTQEVVTVIEVLSPANKRPGKGRELYEEKRLQVLGSRTHLVEIDLLRRGEPMPILGSELQGHYRILVSRSEHRPRADLYRFNLSDPIPAVPLPLRPEDEEPVIDIGALLTQVYDRAGYEVAIDYSREPVPPLSQAEIEWMDELLRQQGLRKE